MIEFKCGQCGRGMEAPQSLAGQVENCPVCKTPNRVPSLASSGSQPANRVDTALHDGITVYLSAAQYEKAMAELAQIKKNTAKTASWVSFWSILGVVVLIMWIVLLLYRERG